MVDVYRPDQRVYDPNRGMVPAPQTPQQSWIDWVLSQIDPRNIQSHERMRNARAQATRDAVASGLGDPIIPPPMATGEQGYVGPAPAHVPVGSQALPPLGDELAPGAPGSALAGPPAPPTAMNPLPPLGPSSGTMGGAALPPLQTPNSMTATPPAVLGGNNFASGPMSQAYPDETGRGLGSPSLASGASGGGGGLGGVDLRGPLPINAEAAQRLYEDQSGMALRQGFQDAGIDSFKNPYAQSAIKRYAQVLPRLMEFFALANGMDINDTASMATWVPQFIKKFMSGEVNPQKLLQHALTIAGDNPVLKEYLVGQGPDELLGLQGQLSGYGARVEGARQRVVRERLARQGMAQLQNPTAADDEAWLNIVRGR